MFCRSETNSKVEPKWQWNLWKISQGLSKHERCQTEWDGWFEIQWNESKMAIVLWRIQTCGRLQFRDFGSSRLNVDCEIRHVYASKFQREKLTVPLGNVRYWHECTLFLFSRFTLVCQHFKTHCTVHQKLYSPYLKKIHREPL